MHRVPCSLCTIKILLSLVIVWTVQCGGSRDESPLLTAGMPLHLEDHLDAAEVERSELPTTVPATVVWRFDQSQPDWKPARPLNRAFKTAQVERTTDALRVTLPEGNRAPDGALAGGIYIDLPDWHRAEWAHVVVRARTTGGVNNMAIGLNAAESVAAANTLRANVLRPPFQTNGGSTPIVRDGTVQTYQIQPNWRSAPPGPWQRVGLWFGAREPGSIDVLSVSVVPTAAVYAQARVGLRSIAVAGVYRRSLFIHAPGRLTYRVGVPEGGRLQAALGVLGADSPVEFRIVAHPASGEATTLLGETYADPDHWAERSVDLSRFAGQTVTLALETTAKSPGTVAFWGAPTLSGSRRTDKPNVILYIIDGAGADYMSVYGYNRRTTPTLEKLAAEGAVFEHAYSNSSWTKPSTASFMTSLHNSVTGNTSSRPVDPLSPQAVTMAERFHRAGYETAVFTSNSNAGTVSALERGVDVLQESGFANDGSSSQHLHQAFWRWRDANPGEPYWVHFQTTDVHAVSNNRLVRVGGLTEGSFAGMFVSPQDVSTLREWIERLRAAGGGGMRSEAFKKTGISRIAAYTLMQGLYDQQMAHNDYQLGRLIERLKASGDWPHTLLIVAADHSIAQALADMPVALLDTLPQPTGTGPMFATYVSRIPLMVVWPGRIAGGQRFEGAVSMIDVLPTVLDLAGLPMPEMMQGQSLAPVLRGQAGWIARPVILDEFEADPATGQLRGRLEVVDGRWGASMWIGPPPAATSQKEPRPWPVLVYDLWNDPICLQPVNQQRPDLVKKYTKFLEDTWKDHRALATRFKAGAQSALTPEQLERLRSLGYIR